MTRLRRSLGAANVVTPAGRGPIGLAVRRPYAIGVQARRGALAATLELIAAAVNPDRVWCGPGERYCGISGGDADLVAEADGVLDPRPEWWAKWTCCRREGDP